MIRSLVVKTIFAFAVPVSAMLAPTSCAAQLPKIEDAKRILILGDSITNAGHYIVDLEVAIRSAKRSSVPDIINLGLSSETCCGLSEPDHPFPRPNVQNRLDDALAKTKPDVVIACYGMNDGIYYPFSEERFDAYQQGIRQIVSKAHAAGAEVVLLTPPPFDPVPLKGKPGKLLPTGAEKYSWKQVADSYDQVIKSYADWILENSVGADQVIDIHTPMVDFLAKKRKTDPDYFFAADGVHLNAEGHHVMAKAILSRWKIQLPTTESAGLRKLVTEKERLLHAAWVSEVGHERPGVQAGIPIETALQKAAKINAKLRQL